LRKSRDMIPAGKVERGERKRTAVQVSKCDKVRIAPVKEFADRVVQRAIDIKSALQVFRPALVAELRERPYEFDIQVQLCTDLTQMPVEDVTVPWPETLSPFVTVAKLRLPQQDIGGDDNLERMDATSMSPWRVTEEHRPLGNIMRSRKGASQSRIPSQIKRNGGAGIAETTGLTQADTSLRQLQTGEPPR
jgi:hypothetical protein